MRASVGDRIVVASNTLDRPVRDGRIIEVRHADGSPPYVVEWSDTGQAGLVFPGPDARVEHPAEAGGEVAGEDAGAAPRAGKRWRVEIEVYEDDADTTAHAVLLSDAPVQLGAEGHAHRHPKDEPSPEIGDEVAVARALRHLADGLLGAASADLGAASGRPVVLRQ